jgi:putative phage-type endonuclease
VSIYPFTVITAEQRSEAWRAARVGRLTGSSAADMLAFNKGGKESAARRDLRLRLVLERITGQPQDEVFVNAAMQRGIDCEPQARGAYEVLTGHLVQTTGFLSRADLLVGCSVDGHVGDWDGIVEIKCPKSATHLRYLTEGAVPADYLPQITHNLWVSGADWCDFLSWDDRFPADMQVFYERVTRAYVDIAAYEQAARAFLAEVDEQYAALVRRKEGAA